MGFLTGKTVIITGGGTPNGEEITYLFKDGTPCMKFRFI